jgi:N-acetylmuramoyl-L-alanine amidase
MKMLSQSLSLDVVMMTMMMNKYMVRRSILFIVILISSCVRLGFAQSSPIRFVDRSGKTLAQVEVIERSGGLYLPIQTLREAFDPGIKQQYSSLTKRLTLNFKDKQLRLRIGSLDVSVNSDEMKLSLSHPPLIVEGSLMLPLEFFTDLLPEIYDFKVTHNPVIQTIHITEGTALLPDFSATTTTEGPAKFLVVIDPGHGGADTGCRGSTRIAEKDIVLDLAKQIEAVALQHQIEVLLTRDADSDRRPKERIDIAQRNYGKLFLSLHCNTSFSDRAAGTHLYVSNSMGLPQLDRLPINPGGTSRDSATIQALFQEEFLIQSRQFATMLQAELEPLSPAPISLTEIPLATLDAVYMPAVLIEIGYLSNEIDEARLTDADHLASIATEIVQAIQTYIAESNQVEDAANGR